MTGIGKCPRGARRGEYMLLGVVFLVSGLFWMLSKMKYRRVENQFVSG